MAVIGHQSCRGETRYSKPGSGLCWSTTGRQLYLHICCHKFFNGYYNWVRVKGPGQDSLKHFFPGLRQELDVGSQTLWVFYHWSSAFFHFWCMFILILAVDRQLSDSDNPVVSNPTLVSKQADTSHITSSFFQCSCFLQCFPSISIICGCSQCPSVLLTTL